MIACFAVLLVGVLGIATRVINVLQGPSKVILIVRRAHTIVGYLITIVSKVSLYVIGGYGYLSIDVIFLVLGIIWKLTFPRLEAKPMEILSKPVRSIKSLKEMGDSRDHIVFANYIYEA